MAKIMFDTPVDHSDLVSDSVAAPEAAAPGTVAPDIVAPGAEDSEPKSALAVGLPAAWSIEPPAMGVRRKARAL